MTRPLIILVTKGGRQVDGSIPALVALEKITANPVIREAQKAGKFTVLFDSGIRRGSDIIKAIAIGAQAVLRESRFLSPRWRWLKSQ